VSRAPHTTLDSARASQHCLPRGPCNRPTRLGHLPPKPLVDRPVDRWDKEGSCARAKKRLFRIWTGMMYYVNTRRFHTQGAWIDSVKEAAPTGAGDAGDAGGGGGDGPVDDDGASVAAFAGYDEDSYDREFDGMIEATNRDPELAALNHLLYDLLTPFALEEKATEYGLVEVQHLLRKFWLPWLQLGGKGHFHVIRHFVRQIMAHFPRSERRAAAAFRASAPNLGGGFGKSIQADAIQELYVLLVKFYLKAPGSAGLHRILQRLAANLHLPMTIIPELDRLWAKHYTTPTRRRSRGGDAAVVRRLGQLAECCYGMPDPGRAVQSAHEGELGRLLRATKYTVKPQDGGIDTKCFIYPHLAGGPPVLADAAVARAVFAAPPAPGADDAEVESDAEHGGDLSDTSGGTLTDEEEAKAASAASLAAKAGAEDVQGLAGIASGDWIEGIEYEPRGGFRPAYRSPWTGRLAGYLRLRHHCVTRPYFPSRNYRETLTISAFTELSLLPTAAGPWLVCRWMTPSPDPSLAWVRKLLPDDCHLVQLAGKSAAPAGDAPLQRLVDALKDDACLVANPLSVREIVREATKFAPRVRVSGVSGRRSAGGALRRPLKERFKPPQQRLNVYAEVTEPPSGGARSTARAGFVCPPNIAQGLSSRMRLHVYRPSAPAAVGSGLAPGRAQPLISSGLQAVGASLSAGGLESEAVRLAASLRPDFVTARTATKVSQVPLGAAAKHPAARATVAPATGRFQYRSALPRRFGGASSEENCGGEARQLKAVVSLKKQTRAQKPRLNRVIDVCHAARVQGDAYNYEWLAAPSISDASAVGPSGGGAAVDGASAAAAVPAVPAALAKLDDVAADLTRRLSVLHTEMEAIGQKMWYATHTHDTEARENLQRRWYGLRTAADTLQRKLSAVGKLRRQRQQEAAVAAADAGDMASTGQDTTGAREGGGADEGAVVDDDDDDDDGSASEADDPLFAPESDGVDSAAEWDDGEFEDSEMTSDGASDDDGS
jgi:hypothetical protein